MTPKMVAKFRRSLSFPNNVNSSSSSSKPKKTLHIRSTSLPCRPHHPVISLLKDQINDLKSSSSVSLCQTLTRLKTVHESFEDLLNLPRTRHSLLHNQYHENLLERFLHFLEVHGTFQTLLFSLKQQISNTQVAIRSKNIKVQDSNFKNLKMLAKTISGLVSSLRLAAASPGESTELGDVIREVEEVTVTVSMALFKGVSRPFLPEKKAWRLGLRFNKRVKIDGHHHDEEEIQILESGLKELREKADVKMILKRMHELEDWIDEILSFSHRIYRSLINSRVSLLNILAN